MMVGPKMTAVHVGLLLKVIRTAKAEEFVQYCEQNTFPRLKFTNDETKLKESFWATACDCFVQLGLATHQTDVAKAA
jgi:hypothetical protein